MKRNWDLIRKILMKLEEKADNTSWLENDSFKGVASTIVNYHFKLLEQGGLITVEDISDVHGEDYVALSLTWQGHEFLDKIHNDRIWNRVKSTLQTKGIDLSYDVIKTFATALISGMLK